MIPGPEVTSIKFLKRFPDGTTYTLGRAAKYERGWRFYPYVTSHRPSQKLHQTMEGCIPRWVGYPDRCETEVEK